MNTRSYTRVEMTVEQIGRLRFWGGIVLGGLMALILSLSFNYFREFFRYFTAMSSDLYIPSREDFTFYDLFYASFSTVLGFCFTIWFWMSSRSRISFVERVYRRVVQANALFVFWLFLMVVLRYSSVLYFVVYSRAGYDNDLNLVEEYSLLFVLIPLVIFLYLWHLVRRVYRVGNWIWYSLGACLLVAFSLYSMTSLDKSKINQVYKDRYKTEYTFIDDEVNRLKQDYEITYSKETISILKKWSTSSSIDQVKSVTEAFSKPASVSIDTIVLQKIMIRHLKSNGEFRYSRDLNSLNNWKYVQPNSILEQVKLSKSDPSKTKELIDLLIEQINLVNTPSTKMDIFKDNSELEKERSWFSSRYIPIPIREELILVREEILNMEFDFNINRDIPMVEEK